MKISLGLLLIVSATYAGQINVNTPQGINELERLTKAAPLIDINPEFDDGGKRIWNPITWITNKLRNKCHCEGTKCGCCFKLRLLDSVGCLNKEVDPTTKGLSVNFSMDDKVLVNKKITLQRSDSVCGVLPPPYSLLKFCFRIDSKLELGGAATVCSAIELIVGNVVGAAIKFKCLQLKDRKLSFPGGYSDVEKAGMLSLKCRNPFREALPLFKRGKRNFSYSQ